MKTSTGVSWINIYVLAITAPFCFLLTFDRLKRMRYSKGIKADSGIAYKMKINDFIKWDYKKDIILRLSLLNWIYMWLI